MTNHIITHVAEAYPQQVCVIPASPIPGERGQGVRGGVSRGLAAGGKGGVPKSRRDYSMSDIHIRGSSNKGSRTSCMHVPA